MTIAATAQLLYEQYREGRFPMADSADGPAMIVTPRERALLPILDLHIPRSLAKTVRQGRFTVTVDRAFSEVVAACASPAPDRPKTWINDDIRILFDEFHRQGLAHSIECWRDGVLVGGLYGLEVGRVFCGESMFSRAKDASKVALVHLCARLHAGDFQLLDAQFHNPHLEQFGLYIIKQRDYARIIKEMRDERAMFATRLTEKELLARYHAARGSPERASGNPDKTGRIE